MEQRSSLPDISLSKRDKKELKNLGNSITKTSSYEGLQKLHFLSERDENK